MNKTELVTEIAELADLTQKEAGEALQAFMDAVTKTLTKGDKLSLIGFGTFSVSERSARTCRNPQTGKEMYLQAKKIAKFKVGSKLAASVNGENR